MAASRPRVPVERRRKARFLALAYPDTDIPLARLNAARAAAAGHGKKGFPTGKGRPGSWVTVGPSQASTRSRSSATPSTTCPTRYVAGGRRRRSRSIRTASPATAASGSPRPAAASGAPRTRSTASRTGSTSSGPLRHQLGRLDHPRPERPDAATRSTSAPVRRTPAAPAASPASASTSRPTAATPGPARSARRSSTAARSAAIASSPAIRTRSTLRRTRGVRASRRLQRRCRDRLDPGRGPVGSLQVHRRRQRPGRSSTTARDDRRLHRRHRPRPTTAARARRAVCAASRSTRRIRTSSTRARTRGVSGARPTAARPGPRSSRRSTLRDTTTRPEFAVTTLPNGKTRMYVYEGNDRRALRRGSSAATTSRPAHRSSRT